MSEGGAPPGPGQERVIVPTKVMINRSPGSSLVSHVENGGYTPILTAAKLPANFDQIFSTNSLRKGGWNKVLRA